MDISNYLQFNCLSEQIRVLYVYLCCCSFQECLCIAFAPPPPKKHLILAPPTTNKKGHPHDSSSLHLAVGYSDGSVRVFSRGPGSRAWSERKMKPHGSPVTKIAFSADGLFIGEACIENTVSLSPTYS